MTVSLVSGLAVALLAWLALRRLNAPRPLPGETVAEADLRLRVLDLEARLQSVSEDKEQLQAQLKVRDVAIRELALWCELSKARVEAWTALDQARAARAGQKVEV